MKWTCKKCGRETISDEKKEFCGKCQHLENQSQDKRDWEREIEETVINLQTLKDFMEENRITHLEICSDERADFVKYTWMTAPSFGQGEWDYNQQWMPSRWKEETIEVGEFPKGSVFLNKFYRWTKQENIKEVKSHYHVEESREDKFRIEEVIIEKKSPQEIQAEIEESKWKCSNCQRKIRTGDRYKETEGKYYCQLCSNKHRERERERESKIGVPNVLNVANQLIWLVNVTPKAARTVT